MNTILTIILSATVIGFLYRGMRLSNQLRGAILYASKPRKDASLIGAEMTTGCLGCISFPFIILFLVIPVYLFINNSWWVAIISIIGGLTIVQLVGYILERLFQLPNHETSYHMREGIDLNAMEMSIDVSLYRRALLLFFIYNITSSIISIFIIIKS